MTSTRIQLALNVEDMAEAIEFYTKLFGLEPHKVRDGYANFAVTDPPLKLVLIENPRAPERLSHLGIEAPTPDEVTTALARFRAAGLPTTVAEQDLCCHAEHHARHTPVGPGSRRWWWRARRCPATHFRVPR